MARNASRVALTLGKEDRLDLVPEELVAQRRRCGRLALRLLQRPARRQEQTRPAAHISRGPLHTVHRNLPQIFWLKNSDSMLEQALVKLPLRQEMRICSWPVSA